MGSNPSLSGSFFFGKRVVLDVVEFLFPLPCLYYNILYMMLCILGEQEEDFILVGFSVRFV